MTKYFYASCLGQVKLLQQSTINQMAYMTFIFHSSTDWENKIGVLAWSYCCCGCSSEVRDSCLLSISQMRVLLTYLSSKVPAPNSLTVGAGLQHVDFREPKHSAHCIQQMLLSLSLFTMLHDYTKQSHFLTFIITCILSLI